jgi:hypothetical protein
MLCFLLFRVGVKKILYSTKKEKQDITLLAQQTKRRKQHKMIFYFIYVHVRTMHFQLHLQE